MGRLIGSFDWSRTPLGALERWPQSLRTSLGLILNSQHPMWIGWGPEATFLYNDAYVQVLGSAKHPWALGKPASVVWAEIWDVIGTLVGKVFEQGKAYFTDNLRLFMKRAEYTEEVFYSFSYSPILDESGDVAGLFCPSSEITGKLLSERRLRTLSELAGRAYLEKTIERAVRSAASTIGKNPDDIPFALLYLESETPGRAVLKESIGLSSGDPGLTPASVRLDGSGPTVWPLADVFSDARARVVPIPSHHSVPMGLASQPISQAIALPVTAAGQARPAGVLVAGVSPARKLDREYQTFFELVAGQVGTAIHSATLAEEERRRAEALAELDRAKTVFFSNVSHELRTPLTLLLGPIENALHRPRPVLEGESLETAHRNALRLLKLVNTLLDFSRIEAGRMHAVFQPVDLPHLTCDLAGSFRSLIEGAGVRMVLDCPPIPAEVYVDPSLWEKIVLNLLSNAYKFTFEGEIAVRLRFAGDRVHLEVSDTGTGIPQSELPRIFERFHRVHAARARSFEGSGIGLALVRELVSLHGGSISVESEAGKGSTFRVEIPAGKAHLPPDRVGAPSSPGPSPALAPVLVEASSWGAAAVEDRPADSASPPAPVGVRVLLADDNADMRDYIGRLLRDRVTVEAVGDGLEALERAREHPPDLILSDVMMPRLDGLALIKALRADEKTRTIPVILISARAGEESRIEGLDWGADDYLVKPFSAQELIARVSSHVKLSRLRREAESALRRSEQSLRARSEELATIMESTPAIIWVAQDPEGRSIVGNRASYDALRMEPGTNMSVTPERGPAPIHFHLVREGRVVAPEDFPIQQVLREGRELRNCEERIVFSDGSSIDLLGNVVPLRNPAGAVRGAVAAFVDVTKLKAVETEIRALNASLEQKVKERTSAMSEALGELETFSYTVAHDLRAPLRSMSQFSDILIEEFAPKLGEQGQEYARRIRRSAERMDQLTRDLLAYSRVARTEVALEPLDLRDVVADVLPSVESDLRASGGRIDLDLPEKSVVCNRFLLSQALTNLVENAVKFARPDAPPRILIRTSTSDGEGRLRLWVEDNGIGIDPSHFSKLFKVFERLDPKGPYKGTGIGLAIVRKAVERMGGTAGAESEPGKGSRFYIDIPRGRNP